MKLPGLKSIYLVALIFSVLALTFPPTVVIPNRNSESGGVDDTESHTRAYKTTELLRMNTIENVTILDDGGFMATILTIVPSSPLAELYRKSLGVATDTVRAFCSSVEQEQHLLLGGKPRISNSRMISRGERNEFMILLSAYSTLNIVNISDIGSGVRWEVPIGLADQNAKCSFVSLVFNKITFIKMMLEAMVGVQAYDYSWSTRIKLPIGITLLNSNKLNGLNWKIDFGGGTYMTASTTVDETSTIILNERLLVTESNITATPQYFFTALSDYKVFKINCLQPDAVPIARTRPENTMTSGDNDDLSYPWSYVSLWSRRIESSFSYGPITASLTVIPSLAISGYVGWDFDWGGLSWFKAWMSITASVDVEFEASATAAYLHEWKASLFEWKHTFWIWVGVVLVWADLQFTSSASLTVDVYASLSFSAHAEAHATFNAGVMWTRENGWSPILSATTSASKTGPTISAEAGASIRPAIPCRIAFLFYGVAGPFIEFCPFFIATILYNADYDLLWEISVNFEILAGVTFAGWLKWLLGLTDWSTTIYRKQLMRWGTTRSPIVYVEAAYNKPQSGSSWTEESGSSSFSGIVMKASASSPNEGCLYGPYITEGWDWTSMLGKPYTATFTLKASSNLSTSNVVYIDVFYNYDSVLQSMWIRASDFASSNHWQDFQLSFIVPNSLTGGIEFRVINFNNGITDVSVDKVLVA